MKRLKPRRPESRRKRKKKMEGVKKRGRGEVGRRRGINNPSPARFNPPANPSTIKSAHPLTASCALPALNPCLLTPIPSDPLQPRPFPRRSPIIRLFLPRERTWHLCQDRSSPPPHPHPLNPQPLLSRRVIRKLISGLMAVRTLSQKTFGRPII